MTCNTLPKLGVVAEGVESEAQQAFLRRQNCDEMQGYHLSRPLPPTQLADMLRERQAAKQSDSPERDSRTVLLVDDEAKVTHALSRLLQREGYQILTAPSAEEALTLLAKQPVRVVISDQAMSGMTGTELLKRVRELYPNTVRILLSGRSTIENLTEAINDSAIYKFLAKPVADATVLEVLRKAIQLAGAASAADEQARIAEVAAN
jgi:response regulator RpfG family c-di-GMP phosphodiesterase